MDPRDTTVVDTFADFLDDTEVLASLQKNNTHQQPTPTPAPAPAPAAPAQPQPQPQPQTQTTTTTTTPTAVATTQQPPPPPTAVVVVPASMSIATPPSSSTSTTPATPPSTSASASASGAASVGASSSSSATGSTTSSGSGGGSSWGARIVGGLGSVMATVLSPLEPTSAAAVMDANDATGGASGGGGSGRPHTPTTASQHPRQLSSSPTTGHAMYTKPSATASSGASASGKSSKQGQSFLSFVMDAVSASPVQQPPKPEPEKRQPPPSSASVAVSPAATLVPVLEPSHTTPTPGEASAKAEATPAQATAPSGGIGLLRSISSAAASAAATAANATTLAVGTTLSVVSYGSDNAAKLARSYSNKLQQQVSPLISIPSVTPAQETPIVPADPFYKQRELMSALEETLRTTRLGLKADFRAGNIQRSQCWCVITGTSLYLQSDPEMFSTCLKLLTGAAVLSDVVQLPPFNPHFREEDHPLTPEQKKALYNIGSALIPQKVDNFTFIPDLVSLLLHVLPVDQAFLASNILLHHSATHSDSLTTIKYFPATTKERSEGFLIFKDAILEHLPSFHSRMTELSIAVEEFAGTWFDRLFVGTLPYNLVLRLMDCFLCEGRSILYQAGLSILYLVSKRFLPETHTHDSLILALLQPMILGSEVPDEKEFMNVVFSYPSIVRRVKASATNLLVENPSKILDDNQFTKLWSWIPARNHISVPEVRFSALRDGFSLQRLYDVCTDIVPLVIIVKSARGNVFGAYIADALHVKPGGYYGTGETFLFSLGNVASKWNWTRDNRYFMCVEQAQLAFGGGGGKGFGLQIDEELHFGFTTNCDTFENEPLDGTGNEQFECMSLEVIAFTD